MKVIETNITTKKAKCLASNVSSGEALSIKRNRIDYNYATDRYEDFVVTIIE